MLVVVCGLPGTGKSTVARRIADHLDALVIRTDVVRRDLFEDPQYAPEERQAVYTELVERARKHITDGQPVVLDGTFHREAYRAQVRELGDDLGTAVRVVEVVCDDATVRERIAAREGDASEADYAVYLEHREDFDPLSSVDLVVDNSGSLEETYDQIDPRF